MKHTLKFFNLIFLLFCHLFLHSQECELSSLNCQSDLTAVDFSNVFDGWIVGTEGNIFQTRDGGDTWLKIPSTTKLQLNDVMFVTNEIGYIVGNEGLVLKTENAGEDWTFLQSNTKECLFAIEHTDNALFIAGANGILLKSLNLGLSWTIVDSKTNNDLYDIAIDNEENVLVVGSEETFIFIDGSAQKKLNITTGAHLNTSVFVLDNEIFISSSNGLVAKDKSDKTVEKIVNGFVRKFAMSRTGNALMVGNQGMVKSQSHSSAWKELNCPTEMGLNDVSFSSKTEAWVVGNRGTVLKINFEKGESSNYTSKIAPNPTSGEFKLSTTAPNYKINIYDNLGALLKSYPKSNNTSQLVDLNGFPSGIYLIQVESDAYSETMKSILINN